MRATLSAVARMSVSEIRDRHSRFKVAPGFHGACHRPATSGRTRWFIRATNLESFQARTLNILERVADAHRPVMRATRVSLTVAFVAAGLACLHVERVVAGLKPRPDRYWRDSSTENSPLRMRGARFSA